MQSAFAVGDRARVRPGNSSGHTRVPRYLRGMSGIVVAVIGAFPLADEVARGLRGNPQPLYTVRFAAEDVWGHAAGGRFSISADLWESYLEVPA